jgi:hypothetical protein
MNINARALLTGAIVLAALPGGPALYAYADDPAPPPGSTTPGDHSGMMGDMPGMSQMISQMSEMMESCSTMMKTTAPHHPETPSDGGEQ